MADQLLTLDADPRELLQAIERLGPAAERVVLAAAKVSADRLADEERRRVARRTGRTANAITVEASRDGAAWVVYVKSSGAADEWPHLDIGLEFGTRHMTAQPFVLASVALEQGPHARRMAEAIEAAIAEVGLGQ